MTGGRFRKQCRRELLLQIRQPKRLIHVALFFIMILVFFPLTMPSNSILLHQFAPSLIWIAILLAYIMASERFFQQDYEDGILEQCLISGQSMMVFVLAKLSAFWILMNIPLVILCPLLSLLFGFSWTETAILLISLLISTPTILSLCALASAFGTGMQQKSLFTALILLPLAVPLMIFGSSILTLTMQGLPIIGILALLLAFSILAMGFAPFAIAGILRIVVNDLNAC